MDVFKECFLVSVLIDHSAAFDTIDPSQTCLFFLSSSFSGVHDTMFSGFTFYFYASFVGVLTCPLTLIFLKLPSRSPFFSLCMFSWEISSAVSSTDSPVLTLRYDLSRVVSSSSQYFTYCLFLYVSQAPQNQHG